MAATYEPIATTTLGSSANSVTFSSIPSTYTDLIVVYQAGVVSGAADLSLQFNGDTASNYSATYLYGSGSSAASARTSNGTKIDTTGLGYMDTTLNQSNIIQIMNYANTTTYKTCLVRVGNAGNGLSAVVGLWRKTPEAINSVKLFSSSNNLAVGSTFTLYGIKAA